MLIREQAHKKLCVRVSCVFTVISRDTTAQNALGVGLTPVTLALRTDCGDNAVLFTCADNCRVYIDKT